MSGSIKIPRLVQAAPLLLALPMAAQVRLGQLSTSLSGTIAPGYTATYGNQTGSTHSWALGGAATLSGSYYNPNFLTFNASFYLNQSRANSNFQSISTASGIDLSANIFSGSHFPGSVTYAKAYNSEGNYSVPGIANYVTHGNSDSVAVNWSENIPDKPSFSAGFQKGGSRYSVYGTNDNGTNSFYSVNLHSSYTLAGYGMGAYYTIGGSHSLIPEVVVGTNGAIVHTNEHSYGYNVAHRLPLQGSISAALNRSVWDSDYLGTNSHGTIDTINTLAAVHPTYKLSFTGSADYSDNLAGQLYESVVTAGAQVEGSNSSEATNSLELLGVVGYTPAKSLQTEASVERRMQHYQGQTYGVNSYSGDASYSREMLDGNFNVAFSITDNVTDRSGENTMGFSATANYTTVLDGWHMNGSFGYAQNVQTQLVTYTSSYYHFSGNARRNWGRLNTSMGAGIARTGLTQQAGADSDSQYYNASLGFGSWISGTGSYSKSSGQAVATGTGLVPVPIPSPVVPSSLVSVYGGTSYAFGLSSAPVKGLIMSGSYAKSDSNTLSDSIDSTNHNNQANVLLQYQFRKLYFTSGWARLEQGFSTSPTPPEVVSSFYAGISRWFNFF